MTSERFEVQRTIAADPATIFGLLSSSRSSQKVRRAPPSASSPAQ
jgi:hypothetical protein